MRGQDTDRLTYFMHNMLNWKATVLQQHVAEIRIKLYVYEENQKGRHTDLVVALVSRRAGPEIRDLI